MTLAALLGDFPAVDYVIIGVDKTPGRATVVGAGSPRDWDIRKGYGLSGASCVFTGANLAKFDIIIDLWTEAHFADWARFAAKYLAKPVVPGTRPLAYDIVHPLLNAQPLAIKSIVFEDITQFEVDDEGLWTCRIKCLEFKAPRPILQKPLAALPAAAKPVPTAQDAADKEIAAKLEAIKKLSGAP